MASPNTLTRNEAHLARLQAYAAEQMATGKWVRVTVDKHGNVLRWLTVDGPRKAAK